MKIHQFESNHLLNAYAAQLFISVINAYEQPVLGLATGETPIGIYDELVAACARKAVSFRNVWTYNLDEYVGLPASHPQSYAYFMNRHLFSRVDLPLHQTRIPNGVAADLDEECIRYEQQLNERPIHLQLLGLGHNGHIAFNEPAPALTAHTHVEELAAQTLQANARFFTAPGETVPSRGLTMGIGSILKAERILLVVRGADKASIVRRALTGPLTTECPASLLQTHRNVTVLLDAEAGKELPHAQFTELAHEQCNTYH